MTILKVICHYIRLLANTVNDLITLDATPRLTATIKDRRTNYTNHARRPRPRQQRAATLLRRQSSQAGGLRLRGDT